MKEIAIGFLLSLVPAALISFVLGNVTWLWEEGSCVFTEATAHTYATRVCSSPETARFLYLLGAAGTLCCWVAYLVDIKKKEG